MAEISLSGKLPRGDANGLSPIVRSLIAEPEKVHALVLLVDCVRITTETETGETIPTMRIRRAEVISHADLKEAQRLIRRGWEKRAGDTVLPIELEDDLTTIFKGIDLTTEPEKPRKDAEEGGEDGAEPGDEQS
jgi:hypothetical protein